MGLAPYTSFSSPTNDSVLQQNLQSVYGSINNVDLFVSGLAEAHVSNARVGQTFAAIIGGQFQNLRSGDRYFWQNQKFDPQTASMISSTSLATILRRNTERYAAGHTGMQNPGPRGQMGRRTCHADEDKAAMKEQALARALFRSGLLLLAVIAAVLLALELRWVVAQVFAAAIVAAGVAPIVARLTDPERTRSWRWRPPPVLVVAVIYLLFGLLALVLGVVVLQATLTQVALLVQRAPELAVRLQDFYDALAQRWAPLEQLDLVDLAGGTSGLTQWIVGLLQQLLNVAGLLLALFAGAVNVIFVLFMALYLTVGGRSMRDYLLVFVPPRRRPQARRIIAHISTRLGGWVLGELLLMGIVGLGAFIGLTLIGVPGVPLLAVIWAVAEVIPGIGPFLSGAPTILLGFAAGPTTGVLATVFTWVWSQVENNVLVPRVMGHAVKLNPLVVLVALLVGTQLLGLAGALFAVPAAGALAVVVDELRQERLLAEQEAGLELDTPVGKEP